MLEFNSETHTYIFNGRVVPSVTQILKSTGFIDTTFYKNDAAERGTYIHSVLEAIDKNPTKTVEYVPDVRGYVEAWERFKRESGITFLEIEQKVFSSKFQYAGTIDRIGNLGGQITIIDIKTGAFQYWHALQTAAYALLLDRKEVAIRACVYLEKSGKFEMVYHGEPVETKPTLFKDCSHDTETFLHSLAICQWKIKKGIKV